ncbi:hypothetical protein JOY44_30935 (plasmid) [Phormidium sp. CLA17]|uniref:hypothetical protein n=1 Tax=Leptolyngbya sp. Cla-17 TaxID=2803751 RepID=UPI0014912CE2|nr:hypothetical protein [Leptolyngbya sp. Cla-17]MBM0745791.1 hypothetical protein [Leptolyngbya sp. Cla-17]
MAVKKYSRQQVIKLAKTTSSRLSYMDRMGFVVPEKIGEADTKKPVVLYTKHQIELVKQINQASHFLSASGLRLAIQRDRLAEVVRIV